MNLHDDLRFSVQCNCGGSLFFKVNSASFEKKYICPDCSVDLTHEIIPLIVNVKESLQQHCDSCQTFNNVKAIHLSGRMI